MHIFINEHASIPFLFHIFPYTELRMVVRNPALLLMWSASPRQKSCKSIQIFQKHTARTRPFNQLGASMNESLVAAEVN